MNIILSLQNNLDKGLNKINKLESNIKSEKDKAIMFQFEYN